MSACAIARDPPRPARPQLAQYHRVRLAGLTLRQCLADAEHWRQAGAKTSGDLPSSFFIRFAEDVTALGMSHERVVRPGIAGHGGRNFPGERTLVFPMDVLDAHTDIRSVFQSFDHGRKRHGRRKEDDLAIRLSRIVLKE